jgi:transposase InsO family protein
MWSLDQRRTTDVTKITLNYALKKRKPKGNLIFHTDRGIEYRGNVFQAIISNHVIVHSLNRLHSGIGYHSPMEYEQLAA